MAAFATASLFSTLRRVTTKVVRHVVLGQILFVKIIASGFEGDNSFTDVISSLSSSVLHQDDGYLPQSCHECY